MNLTTLDDLGYLPFSQAGCALLFHLLSKLYEHTSVLITTNRDFTEWSSVFGNARLTTALLDRLAHHRHIVETGNEAIRFMRNTEQVKRRMKTREQARRATGSKTLIEPEWSSAARGKPLRATPCAPSPARTTPPRRSRNRPEIYTRPQPANTKPGIHPWLNLASAPPGGQSSVGAHRATRILLPQWRG